MERTRFVAWVKRTRFVAWVKQNDFNDLYDYAPVPSGLWIIEPLRGTKKRQGIEQHIAWGCYQERQINRFERQSAGKAGRTGAYRDNAEFRMRKA